MNILGCGTACFGHGALYFAGWALGIVTLFVVLVGVMNKMFPDNRPRQVAAHDARTTLPASGLAERKS